MAVRLNKTCGAVLLAAFVAGCGGGGGNDDEADGGSGGPDPAPSSKFTQSARWIFELPAAGNSICYDFDAGLEVADCAGTAWDLKIRSGGRSATLWTNSGVSGSGDGGAFGGPFDRSWSELSGWNDAMVDPVDGALPDAVYFKDTASGVFTGTNPIGVAAFEYGLASDHLLYPNHRVFLVTTDSGSADPVGTPGAPVFALQITGYYGGASGIQSGYPSFRWVDRSAPSVVREATVDASDNTAWVHFDLIGGTVVDASGPWHIAFNRYNVKLNGGESGSGQVAGFVGKTPAGFYDETGAPIAERFRTVTPADTLAELTAGDMATPAAAGDWVEDGTTSSLNADYRGTYPAALDYGWYRYFPTAAAAAAAGLQPAVAHLLAANPDGAALIRSGTGNSYARFRVTEIRYADPGSATSQQTWTIDFEVQPAR